MWACCLSRKVDCSWLASRAWGLRNIRTGVNSKNYGLKSALLGQNDLPKTSGSNIALMILRTQSTISTWRLIVFGLPEKSGEGVASAKWQRTTLNGDSSKKVKCQNRKLEIAAVAIIGVGD